MRFIDAIKGEQAWEAADRAADAGRENPDYDPKYYRKIARADRTVWARISKDAYWEALNILPPMDCKGGFQVCESICDDDNFHPVYLTILGDENNAVASYQIRKDML